MSDGVVCQNLLVSDSDSEWTVLYMTTARPVLLTLYLVLLNKVSEHHYNGWSLLPHEPPEINHCAWQWTCEGVYVLTSELMNGCMHV